MAKPKALIVAPVTTPQLVFPADDSSHEPHIRSGLSQEVLTDLAKFAEVGRIGGSPEEDSIN